jgi:hypothetical protein
MKRSWEFEEGFSYNTENPEQGRIGQVNIAEGPWSEKDDPQNREKISGRGYEQFIAYCKREGINPNRKMYKDVPKKRIALEQHSNLGKRGGRVVTISDSAWKVEDQFKDYYRRAVKALRNR